MVSVAVVFTAVKVITIVFVVVVVVVVVAIIAVVDIEARILFFLFLPQPMPWILKVNRCVRVHRVKRQWHTNTHILTSKTKTKPTWIEQCGNCRMWTVAVTMVIVRVSVVVTTTLLFGWRRMVFGGRRR